LEEEEVFINSRKYWDNRGWEVVYISPPNFNSKKRRASRVVVADPSRLRSSERHRKDIISNT
jgi:hypothetical protein